MPDFLKLAQEAYEASTSYIDTNMRKDWDYAVRAFRNEHAAGSKYLSPEYAHRSRLYRPKTRTIIRKNEAAGAVALFSNMDVVNVTAGNPDSIPSVANAHVVKELLEYRLTKTIPWFKVCMGALQDAQTMGAVCSYQYWDYQEKGGKKIKDKPCIELRPIENIRLDPGADWLDPVESSPYFCDIIPMYVCDVKQMMTVDDPKTGSPKWKKFDDQTIAKARPDAIDSTRQARLGNKEDPFKEQSSIKDFETVWVMRWFMRDGGEDWVYYTLGTENLLTKPVPRAEAYFHDIRPYVIGEVIIETHKPFKTGVAQLVKPLQQETTELANQRIDNVKFVLNKRWIVARGRQVDVQSLVRNVPGGVTLTTDPNLDIKESNWPDVTSSAYAEQDRLNVDFDDLVGNFSSASVMTNRQLNETVGGMKMLGQGASMMTEYLLRTFIETWVEPVLRQMVLLEQQYETDEVVLGIAADKAKLFQRFGISRVTDYLLLNGVDVTVNVGIGATNPNERLQKFIGATQAAIGLITAAPPGANLPEMIKEIYSNAGYRDGARFFSEQQDPRLLKAMQMIQQLQGALQGKQMELQAQVQMKQMDNQSKEKIAGAEIQVNFQRIQGDLKVRESEIAIQAQELELERLKIAIQQNGASEQLMAQAAQIAGQIEAEKERLQVQREKNSIEAARTAHDMAMAEKQQAVEQSNEERIGKVSQDLGSVAGDIGKQIESLKEAFEHMQEGMNEIGAIRGDVANLGQGLAMMAGMVGGRKKPKGFGLKKEGTKTKAVIVQYDDGSAEEMPIGTM